MRTHTWSSGQQTLRHLWSSWGFRCLAQGFHLSRGQFLLEPRFIRPRLPKVKSQGQEMEERLRAQQLRGTQNNVLWGARPSPTEWDFEEPHTKIPKIPKFLATALRAVTVSGPSTVYHLVFTPILSFLTVIRLKCFSPHGGWRFSIGSSQTIPLLQAIDGACNVRCQACIYQKIPEECFQDL